MDTNKLIVNRILQVREPSAKRLGLDRLEEDDSSWPSPGGRKAR
jgi:hypothetical protein